MGAGDTIKLELYRDGASIAELTQENGSIESVVSIPTAISFALNSNGSSHPDGDWWGGLVLLTVTIGGEEIRHWLRFHNPEA